MIAEAADRRIDGLATMRLKSHIMEGAGRDG
jgi:hypothetical protein